MSKITLVSGNHFDFINPESSKFTIEDIAHGLANTCRYAGQCKEYYSVAEHSVYVSMLTESMTGLMHDATEAFMGDVTTNLKRLLPEYLRIEQEIERVIFERFGIEWPYDIKEADTSVMLAEAKVLLPNNDLFICPGIRPAKIDILCLYPKDAKIFFLNRYKQLDNPEQENIL